MSADSNGEGAHIDALTDDTQPPIKAHYYNIFDDALTVMLIVDPKSGQIVDANLAAERFYGWSRARLRQMHISDINTLPLDQLRAELEAAHRAHRTQVEFRHRRADGTVRDVETATGWTQDGDRALVYSIVHDITERKQAEARSRRWERFFELSDLGIAIHDAADNTIMDVNASYASLHGYAIEEMRHMRLEDLSAPEERAQLPAGLAKADSRGNISFETVHVRKDGSRVPMLVGITAQKDDDGRTATRFAIALDISARKAAEEELRKLSRAVEESPESIVITNTRAQIDYVNQAFIDNTGYARAEVLGQNPKLLQSGRTPPETYRRLWETLTQGKSWAGEFYNRRKDGSEYLERATVTPIHDEHGKTTHYVAVKQDITEERRMEEELLRHRDHLEALVASRTVELQHALDAANIASRAKGDFLATMSHEIRTPMNGVIGLLDVLAHSPLSPEQTHLVKTMGESATTLLSLINDILDFSKIESGNVELDIGPVSIRKLIARVADIMRPLAQRKAVQLITRIEDGVPAAVSSDALRLQQILVNLVSNAVKFSADLERPGRVEIRAESAAAGLIRFMVTDNGIGMAPEVFEKIFQPFAQAEFSTTRRFGGTGLGLSISSRLVDMLKGRIEVRSLPGRGTRFIVTLPLTAINARLAPQDAVAPASSASDATLSQHPSFRPAPSQAHGAVAPRRPILLAEDNDINRLVIERQLALLGLECDMAENGQEALERWRNGRYALLLTDLHMPEMDGYELTARIRSEEPAGRRMPIIAVTANALRGEDQRCIDVGMDDFITKPIQLDVLRQTLLRWLQTDAAHALAPIPARVQAEPTQATHALFDAQILPNLTGGDAALVEELLAAYRISARDTAQSLWKAQASANWRQVGELAHRLKSSSRAVGAMQLGELCAALEHASRDGDGDGERINQLMDDFDAAMDAALQAMDPARTQSSS